MAITPELEVHLLNPFGVYMNNASYLPVTISTVHMTVIHMNASCQAHGNWQGKFITI